MENSRFRTRPSLLLGAVLLSVSTLVACGTGPVGRSAAATVDGHDISVEEVTSLLEAQTRFLESQLDEPGVDPEAVAGALDAIAGTGGQGTFDMTEASGALQALINYRIIVSHVEASGDSVTDADRDAARATVASARGGDEELAKLDADLVEYLVDFEAANTAMARVVPKLSDEERAQRLQELYEQVAPERPLCLSIVMSETEADSQVALERVEAGDDFATVAVDLSVHAQSAEAGGVFQCLSVEAAAETFAGQNFSTVSAGETVGPLELQGETGSIFLLVHIDSTTGPSFVQLQPELEQQLSAEETNLASEFVLDLRLGADVSVDPRYGAWSAETGSVTPPAV